MGLIASSTSLCPCDLVTSISTEIWRHLEMADSEKVALHEPTITQLIGLDIAHYGRGWSSIQLPSQRTEGRTGADIYLVVQGSTGHKVVFLLQAKRLDVASLSYRHFPMAQANRLIKAATEPDPFGLGLRPIPAYLFYNYWQHRALQRRPLLTPEPICSVSGDVLSPERCGCTFAYATKLLGLATSVPHPNRLEQIETISFPWRRLFCCNTKGADLAKDMENRFLALMQQGKSDGPTLFEDMADGTVEFTSRPARSDLSGFLRDAVRSHPERFRKVAAVWMYNQGTDL